jgi:DNA-3-methyladenine glycosylase II
MIPAATLRAAEAHLSRRDKKLAALIERYGPCTLGRRRRDPFHVLCSSIIGQQLSVKAADTIQARVATAVLAGARFMPAHFIDAEFELLRACGLSNAKSRWLIAIAQAVHRGEFSFAKLRRMDDETAIETLDALPGIGRWTAEMFLMFALDRLDIFSLGDLGLRRGLNQLHGRKIFSDDSVKFEKLDDDATLKIAARWAPYRSIASWYLWRIVDGDSGSWT